MEINRRRFLTAAGGALVACGAVPARASKPNPSPTLYGILFDSTLCIGCGSCMVNCKYVNSQPGGALYSNGPNNLFEHSTPEKIWDAPETLSAKTLSIIKVHKNGLGTNKDQAIDGYSFVRRQCMHCLSPACVSVCPVGALSKQHPLGAVTYDRKRCIGCRYCQIACPFSIPKFEWSKRSPQIRKCQLCVHRYDAGGYAACCEFCPSGASIFGRLIDLRKEAQRRIKQKPGTQYEYPVQRVDASFRLTKPTATYIPSIYGVREAGGTQVLVVAGLSFAALGYNTQIPDHALPNLTKQFINKVPAVIGGVIATGLFGWIMTHRAKKENRDQTLGSKEVES